jgi:hypothetical protein
MPVKGQNCNVKSWRFDRRGWLPERFPGRGLCRVDMESILGYGTSGTLGLKYLPIELVQVDVSVMLPFLGVFTYNFKFHGQPAQSDHSEVLSWMGRVYLIPPDRSSVLIFFLHKN